MSPRGSLRKKNSSAGARRDRCLRCFLHHRLCLCASVTPVDLATRVVVLRHPKEVHKPTNTGRLVSCALVNADLRTFGGRDVELDASGFEDAGRRTVLLYPSEDAKPLALDADDARPVTLVVIDTDWRRAFKLESREQAFATLPRVHLPDGPPSEYRLRSHTDPRFVATFEAVARALGILEGVEVQARLEHVFRLMVERTLWSRGQLATSLVTGGVPGFARVDRDRHGEERSDPPSGERQ